jgi:hypothetical protein
MKTVYRVCLFLALAASALLSPLSAAAQGRTITVSNARELVRAIGPDRTLILRKGDYLLSEAYGVENGYAQWLDAEPGRELVLSGLSGLVVRGQPGSRILTDSPTAYLLSLEDSRDLRLEGLVFARLAEEGAEIDAGGIYAENCEGLSFVDCSFEGENGYCLELQDCREAGFDRTVFSGGFYGAVYASGSSQIHFRASTFSSMEEASPLISLEETMYVDFTSCLFADNGGSTLLAAYADSGLAEGLVFDACVFRNNQFDYFAGPGPLPLTRGCRFEGNSFDEAWMEKAVAPEDYYYGSGRDDVAQGLPVLSGGLGSRLPPA